MTKVRMTEEHMRALSEIFRKIEEQDFSNEVEVPMFEVACNPQVRIRPKPDPVEWDEERV
jgi:hypothetical protein